MVRKTETKIASKKNAIEKDDRLILKFRYQYGDYLKINREFLRKKLLSPPSLVVFVIAIIFLLPFPRDNIDSMDIIFKTICLSMAFCMYVIIITPYIVAMRKIKRDEIIFNENKEFIFSNSGISANFGDGRFLVQANWETYSKVMETKDTYFLQHNSGTLNFLIPKRILDEKQEKKFLEILNHNQVSMESK